MHFVPTFAVLLAWLCFALILAGCGYLASRAVLHREDPASSTGLPVVWLGLVSLAVYLQLWNLFFAINWFAVFVPIAAGIVGLALGSRSIVSRRRLSYRPAISVIACAGVATIWVANRALDGAADYDLGLYHLGIVHYATSYPAIPGLANLHERLGADDPNLLFAALLYRVFSPGGAVHLVNGLLAALLFIEVGARFIPRGEVGSGLQFTRRVALLLLLATVVIVGINPWVRVSSLNLDFATFVFVAIGMLYLAESIENSLALTPAVTSIAMLVLAAVTRPLYWLDALLATVAIAIAAHRFGGLRMGGVMRFTLRLAVFPAALAVGAWARQAVLSGYPFFPATVAALPVDWRVPAGNIDGANRWIASWARQPGLSPDQVLASWSWLKGWLSTQSHDLDLLVPVALLIIALVPLTTRRPGRGPDRARQTAAMLGVVVPAAVTLVAWFFLAPDPRFALAPIWIIPVALASWTMPASPYDDFSETSITLTVLLAVGLFVSLEFSVRLLPLAALAVAAGILLIRVWRGDRIANALTRGAMIAVLLASIGLLNSQNIFKPVAADHGGFWGAPREPTPTLVQFRTKSGARLYRPATGYQCWTALFCTPYPDASLQLRGASFGDGLRTTP